MFKTPFSFNGRISRTEYGISAIIGIIILVFLNYISVTIDTHGFNYFVLIPYYWFMFAQGAKRSHDKRNSGWFQLIPFYTLWLLFAIGDFGDNHYGPDPKNTQSSSNIELDAFAYNNYMKTKDANAPGFINDELVVFINKINFYIKDCKRSIFGSNTRMPLLELIEANCKNKEDGMLLLDSYQSLFNTDLVSELSTLSSNYNTIRENVQTFIDLGIVEQDYPHNRIN